MADENDDFTNIDPPEKKPVKGVKTAGPAAGRKMYRIVLEENPLIPPTGLYLGHNDKSFVLKTGEEAIVPQEVVTVLKDAVVSIPQVDPQTGQVLSYRDKMQYPYRILEEIAA